VSTIEIVILVMLVALPYSIYRQMQVNEVTPSGLIKLPLIFVAIGILGFGVNTRDIDGGAGADLYLLGSTALAVGFGVWRGAGPTSGATRQAMAGCSRATARR
jgi:hypothetical protein